MANKTYVELTRENTSACEASKEKYIFSVKMDDKRTLKFNASTDTLQKLTKLQAGFIDEVIIEDINGEVYICKSKYQLEAILRIIIYIIDEYNKKHFEYFMKIMKNEEVKFLYGDVKKSIKIPNEMIDDVYRYRKD